MVKRKTWN